jgi:hypothetical protein
MQAEACTLRKDNLTYFSASRYVNVLQKINQMLHKLTHSHHNFCLLFVIY